MPRIEFRQKSINTIILTNETLLEHKGMFRIGMKRNESEKDHLIEQCHCRKYYLLCVIEACVIIRIDV